MEMYVSCLLNVVKLMRRHETDGGKFSTFDIFHLFSFVRFFHLFFHFELELEKKGFTFSHFILKFLGTSSPHLTFRDENKFSQSLHPSFRTPTKAFPTTERREDDDKKKFSSISTDIKSKQKQLQFM
jgi:hypothetical protein